MLRKEQESDSEDTLEDEPEELNNGAASAATLLQYSSSVTRGQNIDGDSLEALERCELAINAIGTRLDSIEDKDSVIDSIVGVQPSKLLTLSKSLEEDGVALKAILETEIPELDRKIQKDISIGDSELTSVPKLVASHLEDLKDKLVALKAHANSVSKRISEMVNVAKTVLEDRDRTAPLSLFVATWNMGNAPPSDDDMKAILYPEGKLVDTDIVVFGTQESTYKLSDELRAMSNQGYKTKKESKNVVKRSRSLSGNESEEEGDHVHKTFQSRSHKHRLKVENNLKKTIFMNNAIESSGNHLLFVLSNLLGTEYTILKAAELLEMRIYVFVKKSHLYYTTDVVAASQATGVAGIYANKGGVAVSLVLDKLKLCFISCHLAAHKKYVSNRSADLNQIFQNLKKRFGNSGYEMHSEFDHIFVIGDLNYRLDLQRDENVGTVVSSAEVSTEDLQQREEELKKADCTKDEWNTVTRIVATKDWQQIKKLDQLWGEIDSGKVLTDFQEGDMNFLPTFKVSRHTENPVYEETRTPSYCDRILWYSVAPRKACIKQQTLDSVISAKSSDHKPVCSKFTIQRNPLGNKGILKAERAVSKIRLSNININPIRPWRLFGRSKTSSKSKSSQKMYSSYQFRFTHLEAVNLKASDLDGSSDPYVVFCSPTLFPPKSDGANPRKGVAQTSVLRHRLHAKWKNTQVPAFRCHESITTLEQLNERYLVLAVWDKDQISRDDPLGQAVLDLSGALEGFNSAKLDFVSEVATIGHPAPFDLPIVLDSCTYGRIRGNLQILGCGVKLTRSLSGKFSTFKSLSSKGCCSWGRAKANKSQ